MSTFDLASLETAERSVSVSVGLAGDSEKIIFVFGLMNFSTLARSVMSMKSNSMPRSVNMVRQARLVPAQGDRAMYIYTYIYIYISVYSFKNGGQRRDTAEINPNIQ